jgi:chloramphenicol 3-O phosphotransferase
MRRESEEMDRVTRGWHRAVAAIAREGNNVVVDELLLNKRWFDDWEQALEGVSYATVWLRSSAATAEEREAARGDRPAGMALSDHQAGESVAAAGARFDIVIETNGLEADACAAEIQRWIEQRTIQG